MRSAVLVPCALLLLPGAGRAGTARPLDAAALAKELQEIRRLDRRIVHVESLGESRAGRTVERLELGAGSEAERSLRPSLLVVAGTEAEDSIGTPAVLRLARMLIEARQAGDELLDRVTVHLVPRLSPDAAASCLETPRRESARSGLPVDDDHDGLVDEDGPDDLNGDGLLTWMRVEDPEGRHVLDPEEPRLLREPVRTKGERPAWRYLPEGRDDDGDERWNEDGPGGVNLNRNFPFGYEWFAADSGAHQVSEPLVRAMADFLVGHPSIGLVVVYGGADNVAGTPKAGKVREEAGPRRRGRKPVEAIDPEDHPWLERLGEEYREALGIEKALEPVSQPGSLADWAYFHRGRLGLAVAPWRPEVQAARKKTDEATEGEEESAAEGEDAVTEEGSAGETPAKGRGRGGRGGAGRSRKKDEPPGAEERAFLKWLDQEEPGAFVPWAAVAHPDFPGRRVEVGGFAPYARIQPPPELADELIEAHANWLSTLATRLPRVVVLRAEAKALGHDVHEIEVVVDNEGWLPSVLAHGEATRLVHPTRVEIDLPAEAVLAGEPSMRVGPLDGSGGSETVRWIVHAPGRRSLKLTVISALGGRTEATVRLRGGR